METEMLFIAAPKFNFKQYGEFLYNPSENSAADLFSVSAYMPLGLLSIQAYLHKCVPDIHTSIIAMDGLIQTNMMEKGIYHELQSIVNSKGAYFKELLDEQINTPPRIIGISVMFDVSVEPALTLAHILRKSYPNALIILGGHPATCKYRKILEMAGDDLDAISFGEGEKPFVRLVKADNYSDLLFRDMSFVTKDKMYLPFSAFANDVIEDLDEIPIVDYEGILHTEAVLRGKRFSGQLPYYPVFDGVSLMTSRGCPHNCNFCASHNVHGRRMRSNSVERVKQEMDMLVERFGITSVSIKDDHFLFDEERAIEICDYASSKGIKLHFPNGFAMAFISEKFVDCLVRNHVEQVSLALESGSERVLREIIHKPLTLKRATETFQLFAKRDIFVMVYCVIGFPGETVQDIQDSMEYLNNQLFDWVGFSGATPISGSDFEASLNAEGVLTEFEDHSFYHSNYSDSVVQEKFNGDVKMTVELDVNYVHNGMMRQGKYRAAEQYFQSIIVDNPDHAFAYYYRAKCLENLGESGESLYQRFYEIIDKSSYWKSYAKYFNLA